MISVEKALEFHLIEDQNRILALHVPSLTFLEVRAPVAHLIAERAKGKAGQDIVRQLAQPGRDQDQLLLALRELEQLEQTGYLQSPSHDVPKPGQAITPSIFWLHVSHACNLACIYCFASHGTYGATSQKMGKATARQAMEWIVGLKNGTAERHVVFFGGEPLLNMPVMRAAVEHGQNLNARQDSSLSFGVITNGTLLDDETIHFLSSHKLAVTVSVDGPPETQARQRPFRTRAISSDAAIRGARRMLEASNLPVSIRATITHYSPPVPEIFQYFRDLGFRYLSLIPPLGGQGENWRLTETDWQAYLAGLKDIARRLVDDIGKGDLWYVRPLAFYLEKIHHRYHTFDCGVVKEALAISPEGEIYPCSRFLYEPRFHLGNIFSGVLKKEVAEEFLTRHPDAMSPCSQCWARYYCEGGCPYYCWTVSGDTRAPLADFCTRQQELIELALITYARLADNPVALKSYLG
jgi:uncharacterized protein